MASLQETEIYVRQRRADACESWACARCCDRCSEIRARQNRLRTRPTFNVAERVGVSTAVASETLHLKRT